MTASAARADVRASRVRASATVAALAMLVSGGTARADVKRSCVAAADAGQTARDQGRYRVARDQFALCAREACPKLVTQTCAGWLRELDAGMPTIVLGAKDERGMDLTDVRVELDGAPLVARLDGKPIALDPGEHTVRFEREGAAPAEQHVVARAGEKNRLVVVALPGTPPPAPPRPAPPSPPVDLPAALPSASVLPSSLPARISPELPPRAPSPAARIATAATLVAIGALGGGGAAYLLVLSSNASSQAATLRGGLPSDFCTHSSNARCGALSDEVDAQHNDALAAKVVLAGACAFVAAGAASWLLWPRQTERAAAIDESAGVLPARPSIVPSFVPGGGTLSVVGAF